MARHITLATFKTVLGMMPELELAPDGQFERSYTIVEVTDRADFRFNVLKAIELLGHG